MLTFLLAICFSFLFHFGLGLLLRLLSPLRLRSWFTQNSRARIRFVMLENIFYFPTIFFVFSLFLSLFFYFCLAYALFISCCQILLFTFFSHLLASLIFFLHCSLVCLLVGCFFLYCRSMCVLLRQRERERVSKIDRKRERVLVHDFFIEQKTT